LKYKVLYQFYIGVGRMDNKILQKAMDDISTIKEVIDKTGKSFASFSRIFIYWGVLFIVNSIISLFLTANKEQMFELYKQYPILSFVFPIPVIALAAGLIYFGVSKKVPLLGLEKHLMKIWLLILILNLLPPRIEILSPLGSGDISAMTVSINNLNILFFSLAIALVATSLFTGFKQPMHIGAVFIAVSIIDTYFRIPVNNNMIYQLLYFAALPFTFLYTGLYLRSKQLGGTPIGNKHDS
jgi:hypothetical protein